MPTEKDSPIAAAELKALFSELESFPVLVLAVSGGPDSTAMMLLAARWRDTLKAPPKLIAVTVDHGLRKEAKTEAAAVAKLARKLGIAHRTMRWAGRKPATGLQQAARAVRYRLLAEAAHKVKAAHVLTAHTLDDQAETVLIRLSCGSGLTGLGAMTRIGPVPGGGEITLVRPLLDIPKSRLIATLRAAKIPFADDSSNRDPRFTRARLRGLMPRLAEEGLDARRLAVLARRLRRADAAIEAEVDRAWAELSANTAAGSFVFAAVGYARLPPEIALRLLGRGIARCGTEGPVELAKLESLKSALDSARSAASTRFRRSLAGAIVTLTASTITIEPAPPRRRKPLTKRRPGRAGAAKRR